MFEAMNDVPWSSLHHAYGTAEDVPDQLRSLSSDDPEVRRKARHDSYGNIFHQGTRYEASVAAVPFLLELLGDPSTPERAELLELLVALAIGYDESWLPAGFPVADHREAAAAGAALLAAGGGGWDHIDTLGPDDQNRLQACVDLRVYDAVGEGVPLFVGLLEDDDAAVRRMAACALGWFPERAGESAAALVWSVIDADESVAATAALSLGLIGAGQPPTTEPTGAGPGGAAVPAAGAFAGEALAAAFGGTRELVRGAAAVGLARLHGLEARPEVVDALLRLSAAGAGSEVPFYDGNLSGYASLSLRLVLPDDSDVAFSSLLDRIASVSGVEALPVVAEALRRAFGTGPVAKETPFGELTERQQRLVRALAHSPETWQLAGGSFGNFSLMVSGYGLPYSADRMRDYAEVAKMP
ncbi:HEAT repeat domain-containing protein [Actinoplanes sp. LDG1-06]|uniref:HEAT repeat domain-containing protein n=1 Tax=Paractinoplanes ovalisporus TaxID=2810368 RepID=A0ABS2A833_9ACTN|nr:HEAT repeat domain-containing protein [Actinoplanes ovalisporus]MBM2615988.1 HEAT repeat domain-containing protein [Actinoplanes ovalisporus]